MPQLKKIVTMKIRKVYILLVTLPQSNYCGFSLDHMYINVPHGEARRYLEVLAVLNDKLKSDLSGIEEMSVEREHELKFGPLEE